MKLASAGFHAVCSAAQLSNGITRVYHLLRQAVDAINFTSDQLACLSCLDLRTLMSHHPADSSSTATATATAAPDKTTGTAEGCAEAATPSEEATSYNGHTGQTDRDQLKPTAAATLSGGDGVTSLAGDDVTPSVGGVTPSGCDDVTPSADDDVTPASEEGVETTETTETGQDGERAAPSESRKRRRSGDQTETPERKSKVRGDVCVCVCVCVCVRVCVRACVRAYERSYVYLTGVEMFGLAGL